MDYTGKLQPGDYFRFEKATAAVIWEWHGTIF